MRLQPVILCGGSGSRLWPLSRSGHPKQLLALTGDESLLQQTARRLERLPAPVMPPLVICNERHRFLVGAQLEAAGHPARLVLEPEGRNTAPAIALAALAAEAAAGEPVLLLALPADHVINDAQALAAAVASALPAAEAGRLVTFGVVPQGPETGYGYIRAPGTGTGPRAVEAFVEKPDLETARGYVAAGEYFWNSGMFLMSSRAWLEALAAHAPDILEACRAALARAVDDGTALRPDPARFAGCRAESIDYAVMEKTDRASVVPLDAGWSDVGSWAALHEVGPLDAHGNALHGDVRAVDCHGVYVRAESRLVGVVGLEDCVVVETKDAVLVVPRDRAQDVKRLVDGLVADGREEARLGREVFRPWGSYDSLENAEGFQVKRLTVLPGAVLSLQLHHHRAEHWVVVAGRARITRDDEVFELGRNEHTFIPIEARHRIENPGPDILHIIEVQVGDYLGEDDIVRFEDRYGREGRTD